jgi:hypothetical protein
VLARAGKHIEDSGFAAIRIAGQGNSNFLHNPAISRKEPVQEVRQAKLFAEKKSTQFYWQRITEP